METSHFNSQCAKARNIYSLVNDSFRGNELKSWSNRTSPHAVKSVKDSIRSKRRVGFARANVSPENSVGISVDFYALVNSTALRVAKKIRILRVVGLLYYYIAKALSRLPFP